MRNIRIPAEIWLHCGTLLQNDTQASAPPELRRRFGAEDEDETILETNLLETLLCDDGEVSPK